MFPFIRFTNWKQGDCFTDRSIDCDRWFPFIRFTNWKQEKMTKPQKQAADAFPFIRFTNWKQVIVHFVQLKTQVALCFHSYASRIGSKLSGTQEYGSIFNVSIHTLHELEASFWWIGQREAPYSVSIHTLHELEARVLRYWACISNRPPAFPFIRFTNWKQDILSDDFIAQVVDAECFTFPFIRFTNWKQVLHLL